MLRSALILMIACLATGPALAQSASGGSGGSGGSGSTAKLPVAASGSWALNCGGFAAGAEGACQVLQDVRLRKTKQLLLRFAVRGFPKKRTSTLFLQLPHGVYLPDGVRIEIDGKLAEKLEYQTCDARGCYAGKPLSPKTHRALEAGKTLKVVFRNLQKKDINIAMGLAGFAGAYKKMMTK